jgi:hypothetical protein
MDADTPTPYDENPPPLKPHHHDFCNWRNGDCGCGLSALLDAAEERDRLREALREIYDVTAKSGEIDGYYYEGRVKLAMRIARAALSGEAP